MNKRHPNALFILALLLGGLSIVIFFYFPYANLVTISTDNSIVRYPKYLRHQIIPSTSNNYRNHQFQLSETGERSSITVSIPIAASGGENINDIRNFFSLPKDTTVFSSKLNSVPGQRAEQRMTPTPGDMFTPVTNHYELYPSHIPSSPLVILYSKVDGTASLENELAIIKKHLRWSIGKVIGIPDSNQQTNQSATSTRVSVLTALGETSLDQVTTTDLASKILDWTLYKPSSDYSLVSDCGESSNSRLMNQLSDGRTAQLLNNVFPLIQTANPKQWTVAQARTFAEDPTVACGVGAPMPIYTDSTRVLWVYRCLGGVFPDKASPNYQKDVACLQTSEVVSNHFGLEPIE